MEFRIFSEGYDVLFHRKFHRSIRHVSQENWLYVMFPKYVEFLSIYYYGPREKIYLGWRAGHDNFL